MNVKKVQCTHCMDAVAIPESRPQFANATAALACKAQSWIFYGRGKGLCPACNLLDGFKLSDETLNAVRENA